MPLPPSPKTWWQGWCEYNEFLRIWGLRYSVDRSNTEEVERELDRVRDGDLLIFERDLREHEVSGHDVVASSERFLTITINLERPTAELLELARSRINTQRKDRGIKTKRTKPHGADPWDVWDKMQVPGTKLLQITHTLFKVKGRPTYFEPEDIKTKRFYSQVERAYKKAVTLIEEVGKSRNEACTKENFEAILAMDAPFFKVCFE